MQSRLICVRTARHSALKKAAVVHVYWPLLDRREIDLRPLIMYLRALGKRVVLPVMDADARPPVLHAVTFVSEAALKPNRWGILEPQHGAFWNRAAIDVVIVPALAADLAGTRLGYGGGYYDAFLAEITVPTICPVFDACVYTQLPAEPHDMPVSTLITETRVIPCLPQDARLRGPGP